MNTLAALAARAAIRDREYVANYVAEVLAAREHALRRASTGWASPISRSQANFVLFHAGERAIPIRDALRERGVLVRDRSYEIPGCVRVTVGTREQTARFLTRTGEIWWMTDNLVFDMDGVLAEVTESYRETIVQTVQHFTGKTRHPRSHPGLQEPGRLE